jgi:hypothetical protein
LPGVFGKDYAFIDKAGVDVYVDKNRVRYDAYVITMD